jgi:hypothetical protein
MKTALAARLASLALIVALVASACSAGAAGPTASAPTQPPDAVVTSPPNGGAPPPSGGGTSPGDPQPQFVVPRPGQLEVHGVGITRLSATIAGHSVTVQADWWSGVEPCNVLDSIRFVRSGGTFTISLFEGHGPQLVACIDIAVLKATTFSLGQLEPGTYTIRAANGDAPPITITVS